MVGEHPAVVHLVNVVRRQHENVIGLGLADEVEILEDRVGRTAVPALVELLLRGDHVDVLAQVGREEAPAMLDVADQALRLVLREDGRVPDAGVARCGGAAVALGQATCTLTPGESGAAYAVYTARWGLVKLVKQSPEDSPRIVRLLGPGAAVGLESLKEGIYWHAAVAMRETGLCRIPVKAIDRLQAHNAQVAEQLITQWETYVEYADRWITELSAGPVKVRVCRLIVFLIEITHSASREIELPSVEDLAAILGASVESVSRAT